MFSGSTGLQLVAEELTEEVVVAIQLASV